MKHLAALGLLFTFVCTAARAGWDGTWSGNWDGAQKDGVQIIVAGNAVIGIFWHGDYLSDEMHTTVSPDGKVLAISWQGGGATLTRDAEKKARFQIHAGADNASGEVTLEK